jgi:dUTPase
MSYTKEVIENKQNIVYCGDKLTQMMLIPIFHDEYVDVDEETYNNIMKNSQRGDKGFGSSDIKH